MVRLSSGNRKRVDGETSSGYAGEKGGGRDHAKAKEKDIGLLLLSVAIAVDGKAF